MKRTKGNGQLPGWAGETDGCGVFRCSVAWTVTTPAIGWLGYGPGSTDDANDGTEELPG
jgi:hypothetical protein